MTIVYIGFLFFIPALFLDFENRTLLNFKFDNKNIEFETQKGRFIYSIEEIESVGLTPRTVRQVSIYFKDGKVFVIDQHYMNGSRLAI